MNAATLAPSATLEVSVGQCSDRGRQPANQDFHGVRVPGPAERAAKGVVAALADGIGSSDVSHVASEAAVRAMLEDYYATSDAWTVKHSMHRVLSATNSWLHAQTQRGPHRNDHDRGYVCAFAALVLKGRTAHLFHAGDVRIVRLQGARVEQLTADHRVHVGGGQTYLSRALGFHPQIDLDYRSLAVDAGDTFVLASDGLHEHLPNEALAESLAGAPPDLDAVARRLVSQALARGSDDNLSVQILRVEALPPADEQEARRQREGLEPAPLLQPRQEFDGFRIERELHASHRSHVYLATDLDTGARVALKVPSVELRADAAALDRFAMEDWVARRIDSPHVVRAHVRDRRPSHLYVAQEFVEGQTLAQWLTDQPEPPLPAVRDLVAQIARGLQAFHRLEMVHQDLRPENVIIDASGTARLVDFGSTRVAGLVEGGRPAPHEMALGTLAYTAPECFLGEPATERSDLYSLGVLAYRMLCGRLPYGARASRVRTPADVAALRYESARDGRRVLPDWIDSVLARAVHPTPARRHEALSEFVHDLTEPPRSALQRRTVPLAERHPVLFWKAVSLLLLLAVVALLALRHVQARAAGTAPPAPGPARAGLPA